MPVYHRPSWKYERKLRSVEPPNTMRSTFSTVEPHLQLKAQEARLRLQDLESQVAKLQPQVSNITATLRQVQQLVAQMQPEGGSDEQMRSGGGGNCRCFSLCDEDGARDFLPHVPAVVDSPDSPWYGYLQVVYGPQLPLPLNLSGFSFFYHRHSRWPPKVDWPMATCLKNGTLDGKWPLCQDSICSRWRAHPRPVTGMGRLRVGVYRDGISSRGSNIIEVEGSRFAQSAGAADEVSGIIPSVSCHPFQPRSILPNPTKFHHPTPSLPIPSHPKPP